MIVCQIPSGPNGTFVIIWHHWMLTTMYVMKHPLNTCHNGLELVQFWTNGACCLVVIPGTTFLEPCHVVNFMHLIVTVVPLDILLEYWIEHVTFRLLYVTFTFPTRIFCRGVPGFATGCPCGIWFRGLTTCLLYVGPLFGNLV